MLKKLNRHKLKDLKELTKTVLSAYNAGVVGVMYYYGCPAPNLFEGAAILGGSFLMACSSQAINQVIESDTDKLMKRTQGRPIPTERMTRKEATLWSLGLGAASLAMFAPFNYLTPLTAVAIWGGYVGAYIPLKKLTRFNTHVGAIVGALPVYLGWVAGAGTFAGIDPFLVSLFMVAWQFPHFYGIAWTYKKDFQNAGYRMITDVDPMGTKTTNASVAAALTQLSAVCGLGYTGMITYWMIPFGVLSCYKPVTEAIMQFRSYPNNLTGAKLTGQSYYVLSRLFYLLLISFTYQSLKKKFLIQFEKSKKDRRIHEDWQPTKTGSSPK